MIDTEELIAIVQDAAQTHEAQFEKFFLAKLFNVEFTYPAETCVAAMEIQEWMFNPRGTLHGGVIGLIMDMSMGHLLNHTMGPAATIETKIQFLAPVARGSLRAIGAFIKRGNSVQFVESRLLDDDASLIAHATSTWKVIAKRG